MFTCPVSCSVGHQKSEITFILHDVVAVCHFLSNMNKSCGHSGLNVHTKCWENKNRDACLVQSAQSNKSILVQAALSFLETP